MSFIYHTADKHCTPISEKELTRATVMVFKVVPRETFTSEVQTLQRRETVSHNSTIGKLTSCQVRMVLLFDLREDIVRSDLGRKTSKHQFTVLLKHA